MNSYPKSHLKAATALTVLLAIAIGTLPAKQQTPTEIPIPLDTTISKTELTSTVFPPLILQNQLAPHHHWIHIKVKRGDNLAQIFRRFNLPALDLQNIIDLGEDVTSLRKIIPGQELSIKLDQAGKLLGIRYHKTAFDTLLIHRIENRFVAQWQKAETEKLIAHKSATITKDNPSLYHAGKATGLSDSIIMKLSYIYQWDISFALDLRTGDSFSLMYEELYVDGERVEEGNIIGSTFTNMGKVHQAVRYTNLAGRPDYYTPTGDSMRKAFIRDPVHFSYVSSSFNLRRLHPIHKSIMPHRGIDYAAKSGTPVVASGDGRIATRRENAASGRYVIIQHGETYTTKYLHLSAFARGIKPGAKIKQGQTIGYVGSSGWATGPHLHYEFLVDGLHRNPKTVKLPQAEPVAKDEMQRFLTSIQPILAQLNVFAGTGYASAKDNNSAGD